MSMREVEVYSCNKPLAEEELKSGHKYLTVDIDDLPEVYAWCLGLRKVGVDGVPESDIETIIEYANTHTLSGVVSALARCLSDKDAEGIRLLAIKCRKGM